ncbi:MCE family protein [Pseudonocardia oroxyli]|uniref:Virulence factor Mce family protein n=1 Tax=Pseudonocardia oroxyli TaxID=366584 RepID=A0A1G7GFL5_PSEOR|nr:MCE family protein [Pseudonocardia oroxyli]SDE86799.1 virulence factor Mce family protein [Pseudonocardia oroxyli]
MAGSWAGDKRLIQIVALGSVIAVLAATGVWLINSGGGRKVTAYFTNASALFEDNEVRVLGVPVGTIDTITPEGTQVKVDMTITDPKVHLAPDAKAAVVSPSLVTGRYVQLFPTVAEDAPQLPDGATIPLERTAVPLGVDDLARTATELSKALGPNGANANGAVSDALDVGAQNLAGNGQALNDTITGLGNLSSTLAGSSDDLYGTVTELQKFTQTLAQDDAKVREFNGRIADVTGFLADDREELGGALHDLGIALGDVAGFVRDNRDILRSNVDRLSDVTSTLVEQRRALTEILDVAPLGVSNLANTYNGASGTLDTRANLNELGSGGLLYIVCDQVKTVTPEQLQALTGLLDACRQLPDPGVIPSPVQILDSLYKGRPIPVAGLAIPTIPPPTGQNPDPAAPAPQQGGAPAAPLPAAPTTAPAGPAAPQESGGIGGFFSTLFGGGS